MNDHRVDIVELIVFIEAVSAGLDAARQPSVRPSVSSLWSGASASGAFTVTTVSVGCRITRTMSISQFRASAVMSVDEACG